LLRLATLSAFALSGSALWVLFEHARGPVDEPEPNPLTGQPVPAFAVPPLQDGTGLATRDFAGAERPVLLNFFASWCAPCVQEIPVLLALRQQGLAIWGIAYRDTPAAATAFLARVGNPYQRIGRDDDGATGPAFALSGVPASFLVDRSGIVQWSWAGRLSPDVAAQALTPLLNAMHG